MDETQGTTQAEVKDEVKDGVKSSDPTVENKFGDEFQEQLEKAISKLNAQFEKRIQKMENTAKLQQLSDDDRKAAELEQARGEIEQARAELKRKELELSTAKVLEQRGIPSSFMNYFIDTDAEKTLTNIKAFEKVFKSEVEKAVNEKLKGKAPASSGTATSGGTGKSGGGLAAIIAKNKISV